MLHRFFILILTCLIYLNIQAQNGLDTVIKANDSWHKEDARKIVLLLKLSKGLAQNDPLKAFRFATQASEISSKLQLVKSKADAAYHLGDIAIISGDYVSGAVQLRKAMQLHDSIGLKLAVLTDSLRLCDIYRFRADHKSAIAGYQYLAEAFAQQVDEVDQAKAMTGMAASLVSRSELQRATELNEKALSINKRLNNLPGLAANYINIARIHSNQSSNLKAIEYYQKAYEINERIPAKFGMSSCLRNIGILYNNLSNFTKAVDYYHRALRIDEELNNQIGVASELGNLGVVYGRLNEYSKALDYFLKAYEKFRIMNDKYAMSYCLGNIGNIYALQFNEYDKAIDYYQQAMKISEENSDKRGIANHTISIGNVYNSRKDYTKALEFFKQALVMVEKINDKATMAIVFNNMSLSYQSMSDPSSALFYTTKARAIAKEIRALESEKNALRQISEIYERLGKWDSAYIAFKEYSILKDSSSNDVMKSELSKKELQFEFEKKETEYKYQQQLTEEKLVHSRQDLAIKEQALLISTKEKDLQRLEYLKKQAELESERVKRVQKENEFQLKEELKQNQIVALQQENDIARLQESKRLGQLAGLGGMLIGLCAVALAFYFQNKKKQKLNNQLTFVNAELITEKSKSDDLLLNILPAEIAEELKQKGKAEAKKFDSISVIFTDFVNFTGISQNLSPEVLVREIDTCFQAFDHIMEKYGVEKIKTIGDAYMAASGLPHYSPEHALKAVLAAREMAEFIADHHQKGGLFEIRIGVHSGPVIAGIVGNKKFAYDIWGDTVNTAARMEQNSISGHINISGSTYELVKDYISCSYRGKIAAKNKGEIDMYFVT